MCWTRGGSADFDAWVALGNPGWGWDDLLPYFKKAENYTQNVDPKHSRDLYIMPNASSHGDNGYIHVSYPRYFYEQSRLFLQGLQELGIPILTDPNNGTAAGGMLIPNSLSPDNQTRSSARLGYFDGFIDNRPNFHIATGQHVSRMLLRKLDNSLPKDYPAGLWINGVEFVSDGSMALRNVTCRKEVILAAGNAHTSQILELSGIGQADVLDKFGIPIILNLNGVGENFQDHPYVGVYYYYDNASYFNIGKMYYDPVLYKDLVQEYYLNKSGPWTSGAINTVAFPSLQSISQNWTNMMLDAMNQNATQYLLPNLDSTIITGYEAQKSILVDLLSSNDVGAYEILSDNRGLLSVSAMHTFSRGNIHIQSMNPFIQPLIDPRYCSNPLDCQVLVEGLLFNNRLVETASMKLLEPTPYYPFFQDASSKTLMPAINSGLRTGFHGTGATSMLPLEMGGVVDTHLRVYGTNNLRIVDAGIMPLIPASHLQASVYAVAEKAADIIKADNLGKVPGRCGANSIFAVPDPVLSNISSSLLISMSIGSTAVGTNTSTSVSISAAPPTASTWQQLLNSSNWEMLNLTAKPKSTSASKFFFVAGGMPSQKPSPAKNEAVFLAASIFIEPTSSPSLTDVSYSSEMDNKPTLSDLSSEGLPLSTPFKLDLSSLFFAMKPASASPQVLGARKAARVPANVKNLLTSISASKPTKTSLASQTLQG